MSIPVVEPSASDWSRLDPAAKREHLLTVAAEIFTRDGLDAPMPVIADAAGAGVASVYRQFPSKHELLAALVIRRLEQITAGARHASATTSDHWTALTELLWTLVEQQRCDEFLGEAMLTVNQHPAVQAASTNATNALDELLAAARTEGRLRADATTHDLRLLFAATRAAKHIEPTAGRRMLQLLIDALDTHKTQPLPTQVDAR
jgi:AcrR family transcriptional regulator